MESETDFEHVPGLWFNDCGLILRAGNQGYRVSCDLLALHSPVFKDMLDFPPPEDSEIIDGCPVVRLPDPPTAMTHFLQAIYDFSFFQPYPLDMPLQVVLNVLRLSHKYQVDALFKRALRHLSEAVPTSLESYRERRGTDHLILASISVINAAREVSADWVLPFTLYQLCVLLCVVMANDKLKLYDGLMAELAETDKHVCLRALRSLDASYGEVVDFLLEPLSIPGCTRRDKCMAHRVAMRRRAERRRQQGGLPLDAWPEAFWKRLKCCSNCERAQRSTHDAAERAVWDKLPAIFSLPDWPTLERMKAEALADQ
ncbi:hypothetical protein C8J57DRAFT_472038 [Mycena rebaudengoi]|nr:hypothetical protein C8J57DRAFT_472038 [Mycena rebaudengoi]